MNQYTDINVEVSTKFHYHLQNLFEYNCYFLYNGRMQRNVLGIISNSDCKCNSGLQQMYGVLKANHKQKGFFQVRGS